MTNIPSSAPQATAPATNGTPVANQPVTNQPVVGQCNTQPTGQPAQQVQQVQQAQAPPANLQADYAQAKATVDKSA